MFAIYSFSLASIQRLRKIAKRAICSVFGIATDGTNFQFVKLDDDKNLLLSPTLSVPVHTEEIYSWIDAVLLTAVHSSPNTTPRKPTVSVPIPLSLPKQYNVHSSVEWESREPLLKSRNSWMNGRKSCMRSFLTLRGYHTLSKLPT
jgi:hypothetical protein